jgi:hypothetical protein
VLGMFSVVNVDRKSKMAVTFGWESLYIFAQGQGEQNDKPYTENW